MGPYEIAAYTNTCFGMLTAIALIVVGALFARPAHATAGMVIIAGGGVQLLTSCCIGVLGSPQLMTQLGGRGLSMTMSCGGGLADAVTWGLVAYGAVLLAQAVSGPSTPPAPAQPADSGVPS